MDQMRHLQVRYTFSIMAQKQLVEQQGYRTQRLVLVALHAFEGIT